MPTPAKGPRLGGGPAHERLLLANLASSLFEHRRITTTETKAKRLRPVAERLITFAKRGDLAARRRVLRIITDKGVVHELFTDIAPAMQAREGGYTRITKIGNRKGDNAPMAVIELVLEALSPKQAVVAEATAAKSAPAKAKSSSAKKPAAAEENSEKPEADSATDADEASSEDSDSKADSSKSEKADAGKSDKADSGKSEKADAEEAESDAQRADEPDGDHPKLDTDDADPRIEEIVEGKPAEIDIEEVDAAEEETEKPKK